METKLKNLRVLWIALGLLLLSAIGASIVQTSGGRVEIKDLRWETPSGRMMSALLFIPENVSSENPARESLPATAGTTTVRCRILTTLNGHEEAMWLCRLICTGTVTRMW